MAFQTLHLNPGLLQVIGEPLLELRGRGRRLHLRQRLEELRLRRVEVTELLDVEILQILQFHAQAE
jgi:hypothetical protein